MPTPPDITDPELQRLIKAQAPMVKKIAHRLANRLPASVERDDLVQDGMLGLINALLRWTRETTGQHFESYVAQRAQGAMLDGLRAIDPGTRQRRKDMRQVEIAIQKLSHEKGRSPQEGEVAEALGLPIAGYQRILQEVSGYVLISLDDLAGSDDPEQYLAQCAASDQDPLVVLERAALRQTLAAAIQVLPEQKNMVLRLYYEEELKMHEIGSQLRLSEARVSQLHTQAIAQLRAALFGQDPSVSVLKPRTKARVPSPRLP
jgi:RNA polymerase sigma factor for flagellar operon FliA